MVDELKKRVDERRHYNHKDFYCSCHTTAEVPAQRRSGAACEYMQSVRRRKAMVCQHDLAAAYEVVKSLM